MKLEGHSIQTDVKGKSLLFADIFFRFRLNVDILPLFDIHAHLQPIPMISPICHKCQVAEGNKLLSWRI